MNALGLAQQEACGRQTCCFPTRSAQPVRPQQLAKQGPGTSAKREDGRASSGSRAQLCEAETSRPLLTLRAPCEGVQATGRSRASLTGGCAHGPPLGWAA